jgi:hypothetical protein
MDYQKQATDFLAASGLEFRAVLIGDDCPTFCEDALAERDMDKINVFPRKTHIHGKHYRCTISGKDRGHLSFDFWNSYSDEKFNHVRKNPGVCSYQTLDRVLGKKGYSDGALGILPRLKQPARIPTPYDLLACVQKHDVGTLADFCGDFGYDTDSKRAEQTYIAVCKEYQKIRKFFTDAELEALQEIA